MAASKELYATQDYTATLMLEKCEENHARHQQIGRTACKTIFWKKDAALEALTSHAQALVRVESVTDEGARNHYEIFSSPGELYARLAEAPNSVSFHEITRIATDPFPSPQRMYFDIDAPRETWGRLTGQEVETRAAVAICEAAKRWATEMGFHGVFRAYVAGSSDYISKVSLHVIFPDLLFKDHGPLKRAAMRIVGYLEPWLANCVDVLYKRNQGLRLLWARKAGTNRQKVPLGVYSAWSIDPITALIESTIHVYNNDPQHCIDNLAPPPKEWSFLGTENTSDLMAMLGALEEAERAAGGDSLPAGGAYRELSTQFLPSGIARTTLRRTAPSHCIVCQRVHESENPYVMQKHGVYRLYCRRAPQINGRAQSTIFYVNEGQRQAAIAARQDTIANSPRKSLGMFTQAQHSPLSGCSDTHPGFGTPAVGDYEDDTGCFPNRLLLYEEPYSPPTYDDEELMMRLDI